MNNTIIEAEKIQGWFSKEEMLVLVPILQGLRESSEIVELGTFKGRSSLFFRLSCPTAHITTIDNLSHKDAGMEPEVLVSRNITQLIGGTTEVAKQWEAPIDLLFVDANHSYEAVKADIEAWEPFVKEGGYIVFHDYYWEPGVNENEGVKRAADEWMETSGYDIVSDVHQMLVVQKPYKQ